MKKILSIALVVVLLAGIAVSGTMAYLTDTDSEVNVMTLGNVKIDMHEFERKVDADGEYVTDTIDGVESYVLQDFTQNKPLYPFVGEVNNGYDPIPVRLSQLGHNSRGGMDVLPAENVQDKFVVVENTGKNDAYVRTIVAFEAGSVVEEDWYKIVKYSSHFTWKETQDWFVTEIDGNNYYVVEFVYNGYQDIQHPNGVLTPGDYTYNSLAQVYMFDTATNEDCINLDGNKNGLFDILVLSQAVQTAGFDNAKTALDTAFGAFNAENAKAWFEGSDAKAYAGVEDAAGLNEAFTEGGSVMLKEDIADDEFTIAEDSKVDVNLNDKKLEGIINNNGELNISDGSIDSTYINNYDKATFTNVEMEAGTAANYANISRAGSETVYNNVDIVSGGGGIAAVDGAKVTFNSGSVAVNSTSTSGRYLFYTEGAGSEITINGGEFSFSKTLNQKRAYIYAGAGTYVYVNGGTFGPASTRSGYTAGIMGEGTVIIKGGTFGFDPSNWVADGYQAVKDGSVWVVSAK